eukprot:UN05254
MSRFLWIRVVVLWVVVSDTEVCTDLNSLNIPYVSYQYDEPRIIEAAPMSAKFRNFRDETLYQYWDDGTEEGVYTGKIPPLAYQNSNTYVTHTFIYRDTEGKEVVRFTMTPGVFYYVVPPFEGDTKYDADYKALMEEITVTENYR